ncbi:MAG TPA: hypothetical protein VNT31_00485 [Nocardioides sp.]|nr:hypothetical protein [Nocardioides sp.]
MTEMREPDLSYVIPGWSENRWSDLLASLIKTDPQPMGQLIGVVPDDVRREVAVPGATSRKSDRLDLLLTEGGGCIAAIEVKVLSDLGPDQLARYSAAFPGAKARYVLHLAALPVNTTTTPGWGELSWETVLASYSRSAHPWVAATAKAWLTQLGTLVPRVDANTVWNDVPDAPADFEVALRARVAWLSSRMSAWCDLHHDTVQSSGGGNWALRMWTDSTTPDHLVTAELQEGMTAYEWRFDPARRYRDRLRGPVVLVGLRHEGSPTSASFAWPLLHRIYSEHILDDAGNPRDGRQWRTTSARPGDPVDKQNWQAIVQAGAPPWLGQGWGMKVARTTKSCLFGARFAIAPTASLAHIDSELQRLQPLLVDMAATEYP